MSSSYQDYLNHIVLDIDGSNNLSVQYLDEEDNVIETYYVDTSHHDVSLNDADISFDHEIDICMNASIFNKMFLFYPSVRLGGDLHELSKIEYAIDHTQWKEVQFSSLQLQDQSQDLKTHFLHYMVQQFYGDRQDISAIKLVKNKSDLLNTIQSYDSTYNKEIVKHLKTMGSMLEPENNENNASNYLLRSYITISKQNDDRRLAFLENVSKDFDANRKQFIKLRFQKSDVVSMVMIYKASASIVKKYKINFIMDDEEVKISSTMPYQATLTISNDYFVVDEGSVADASNNAYQHVLHEGSYLFQYDDSLNPVTFLNHGKENMFRVYGETNKTSQAILPLDDVSYSFYWGKMHVNVYSDFNYMSLCKSDGSYLENGYQFLAFDSSYTRVVNDSSENMWIAYGKPNRIYGGSQCQHVGEKVKVNEKGNVFYTTQYDAHTQNKSIEQYTFQAFDVCWNHTNTIVDPNDSSNADFGSVFCLYQNYLFISNQDDVTPKIHFYQYEEPNVALTNSLDISAKCVDGCMVANNDLLALCLTNNKVCVYKYSFSSFEFLLSVEPFTTTLMAMTANGTLMNHFVFMDQSFNLVSYDLTYDADYTNPSLALDASNTITNPFNIDPSWSHYEPCHSHHCSMDLSGYQLAIGYPNYEDQKGIVLVYGRSSGNPIWTVDTSFVGYDISHQFFGNIVRLHTQGTFLTIANGSLLYSYPSHIHAYSVLKSYQKGGGGGGSGWTDFGKNIMYYDNAREHIISDMDMNQRGNVMVYGDPRYSLASTFLYDASYQNIYKVIGTTHAKYNGLVTCVIKDANAFFFKNNASFFSDLSGDDGFVFNEYMGISSHGDNSLVYPYKTLIVDASHAWAAPQMGSTTSMNRLGDIVFMNHQDPYANFDLSDENQPLYSYVYFHELDEWHPNAHFDLSSSSPSLLHHDICENYVLLYNGVVDSSACYSATTLSSTFDGNQVGTYQKNAYVNYEQHEWSRMWSKHTIVDISQSDVDLSAIQLHYSLDGSYVLLQKGGNEEGLYLYQDSSFAWDLSLSETIQSWTLSQDFHSLFVVSSTHSITCYDLCLNTYTLTSRGSAIDASSHVFQTCNHYGNTLVVGIYGNSGINTLSFRVYVYDGNWTVHGNEIALHVGSLEHLTFQCKINDIGNMIYITQTNTNTQEGKLSVYVYHSTMNEWTIYYSNTGNLSAHFPGQGGDNARDDAVDNASWGRGLSINSNGQLFMLSAPTFSSHDLSFGAMGIFKFVG